MRLSTVLLLCLALRCGGQINRFLSDKDSSAIPTVAVTPGPSVVISSAAPDPTATTPFTVTFTFSAAVTGFALGDITVGNGTTGNFITLSGTQYTADITPTAAGLVTVDVAAAVAQDASANGNSAATQLTRTYDNVGPTMTPNPAQNFAVGTAFTTVDVTYSETVVNAATLTNYVASGAGKGTWSTNPVSATQNGGGCGTNCYRLVFTGSPTDGSLVITISNVQDSLGNNLSGTTINYLGGWTKHRKLTIDNSAQAQNLTNFPLLVRVDSGRIDYANTQNSGQDIRFYDSDGTTLLPHEIEVWNESGSSYVWVKVPQIDASSSTDFIWMYYGNSSVADGQNATNVWDANFKGVWHMTSSANDATTNANNGVNVGVVSTVTGQIGDGRSFNGTNQYINLSGTSIVANTSTVTLSTWVNRSGNVATEGLIAFSINNGGTPTGTSRLALEISGTTNLNVIGRAPDAGASGARTTTGNPIASTGTWYHIVVTLDFAAKTMAFYVNGSLVADNGGSLAGWTNSVTDNNASASAALGAFDDGTVPFLGSMDEIRLSNSLRSAAWIAAEYKSGADTFITFGPEL